VKEVVKTAQVAAPQPLLNQTTTVISTIAPIVTSQEIVRMRRFTHFGAAYLRITLEKIIECSAIRKRRRPLGQRV
jgi:hypothetical protein